MRIMSKRSETGLQAIIKRLHEVREECESIRKAIEDDAGMDADIIAAPMWSVKGAVEEVVGALMLRAYGRGEMAFGERKGEVTP